MNTQLIVLIAALGGVAVAVQAQFMAKLDQGLGTLESVFITYGGGGLLVAIYYFGSRGFSLPYDSSISGYNYLAGVAGLVIVSCISFSTPRLGVVAMVTIMLAGQFLAAAMIDHFGLLEAQVRPINTSQIGGLLLVVLGAWLVSRGSAA